MTIEELKNQIENKTISKSGLVFVCSDRFLADQYVKAIANIFDRDVRYVVSLETDGFFGYVDDGNLSVLVQDEFNDDDVPDYTIVITKKSKSSCAVKFPKLESWHIKDYVYSTCPGVQKGTLDKFLVFDKDLYHLDNELDKIRIFDDQVRDALTDQFIKDGAFEGLSPVDTFEFIKAVQNNDRQEVAQMVRDVNLEPLAFVALLYKQFSNMVMVYLQQTPTEANTGLKSNQIWAISKACQRYTRQQILDVYKFLSGIDFKLKTGELSTDIMFDYVLYKVLRGLSR